MRNKAFRDSVIRMFDDLEPQYAITLSCNRTIPWDNGVLSLPGKDMQQCLRSFSARLDRRLLGSRWVKKTEERSKIVMLPENLQSNSHAHGILRIHPAHVADFKNALVEMTDPVTGEVYHALPLWRDVMPSGTSCIKRLSRGGSSSWGSYCCKDDPDPEHLFVT